MTSLAFEDPADEIAFLKERLRLAADVIHSLAQQQAMSDDWYEGPLALVREAGR